MKRSYRVLVPMCLTFSLAACPGSEYTPEAGAGGSSTGEPGAGASDGTTAPTPADDGETDTDNVDTDDGETDAGEADAGDTDAGDTDGDSDSRSTGDEAACDVGDVCAGDIPDGWSGPGVVRPIEVEGEVPNCGGFYQTLEIEAAYTGLAAAAAECTCDCEAGILACDGSARIRVSNEQQFPGQSPCSPGNGGLDGLLDNVIASGLPESFDVGELEWLFIEVNGLTIDEVNTDVEGSCAPDATEVVPDAAWSQRAIICSSSDVGEACGEGQSCVPAPTEPFGQDVCIWTDGDVECPAAYPEHSLYYTSIQDDRGCSECSCGDPEGDCVDPTMDVTWYIEGGGLANPVSFDAPTAGQCVSQACPGQFCFVTENTVAEISFDPGELILDDPSAPCDPAGGVAQGSAAEADPLTVCCAPA